MTNTQLTLREISTLAEEALIASGASAGAASSLAAAITAAERDGIRSHGLIYVPIYCEHLKCGKVNAAAEPTVLSQEGSAIVVDADCGFAHPAIDIGFDELRPLAKALGCAALTVRNSYNCGVLGYHESACPRMGWSRSASPTHRHRSRLQADRSPWWAPTRLHWHCPVFRGKLHSCWIRAPVWSRKVKS